MSVSRIKDLVGEKAPSFCLKNQSNNEVCLDGLLKSGYKFVLLYFYPKDLTSGCTTEAKSFSSAVSEFEKLGVKVVGVSKLGVESKQRFIKKHNLKIELLADEDLGVAKAYGVLKKKKMFGKEVIGISRETFLIDSGSSKIIKHWTKVNPKTHVAEVLSYIATL